MPSLGWLPVTVPGASEPYIVNQSFPFSKSMPTSLRYLCKVVGLHPSAAVGGLVEYFPNPISQYGWQLWADGRAYLSLLFFVFTFLEPY